MPAVREDHDPLKWLAGIGTGTLLAFIRWSDFRCPYCGEVFRRTYLPSGVMLGSGERTCPTCGKVFDDGFREWPELSFDQKVQHVLPVPIMGDHWGLSCVRGHRNFHLYPGKGERQLVFLQGCSSCLGGLPRLLVCRGRNRNSPFNQAMD